MGGIAGVEVLVAIVGKSTIGVIEKVFDLAAHYLTLGASLNLGGQSEELLKFRS